MRDALTSQKKQIEMKPKEQRGKEIARFFEIKFDETVWIVPSESEKCEYQVDLQKQTCAVRIFKRIN